MATLGGIRPLLGRGGIMVSATYIGEVLGNPSGGVKQSTHYDGLLDVHLDANMEKMIGEGNEAGNEVVQRVIDALLDQTKSIERAVAALDLKSIEFEGSDSLDNPGKVQGDSAAAGDRGPKPN